MSMNPKKKEIEERIQHLEAALEKAREYLENGSHAHWHGFRALFKNKIKDGKVSPPHKDWIRNVFIPSREKAVRKAEAILDRME